MKLIAAYPKVGSTWLRFVIFNYFHELYFNIGRTLTFQELERALNLNTKVKHTHNPYSGWAFRGIIPNTKEYYATFDKIIYMWRNPYDTMISYWHYLKNRDIPFYPLANDPTFKDHNKVEEWHDLRKFVEYNLPMYIDHIQSTMPKADLVLYYDDLWEDPSGFKDAIILCSDDGQLDEDLFTLTIERSSFLSIRRMGISTKTKHGGATHYKGHFTRKGTPGQYKTVMDQDLIDYITDACNQAGIEVEA